MDQVADKSLVAGDFAAEAFLARLGERGIEYVFANAGTDFAPIIEAVSRNGNRRKFPRFVTAPHENLAMAMANGYYRVAGKPAAVMLHVTVGTANAVCQVMNMARDNVPVMLCAGRTPITEAGHIASRNLPIHWGQEAFDQGGMLREFVKWDYELRAGQPVGALVDRALDIAMSEPRGPVYLCLPREVLADDAVPMRRDTIRPLGAAAPAPSLQAIEQAAHLIAGAEYPLIITSALGRSAAAVAALSALCGAQAIPVLQMNATDMNLPSDHEMNLGYGPEPTPHLAQADVVIVIDSGVPWIPRTAAPKASAKVIHIGIDPLVSRHPFREYEADLLVAGDPVAALVMLNEALGAGRKGRLDARRKTVAAAREEAKKAYDRLLAQSKNDVPIHPVWLAHCLNAAKARDAIIVNELGVAPGRLDLVEPLSFIGTSLAGGLGAGLGTALGAKLAAPEREVIVTLGDGSYMFGNPVPYHFVQRAENLPTLTIVTNNHQWLAVKQATLAVYPDGAASRANVMPIQDLNPSPAFEKVAECCDGFGESVEDPAKLPDAIARALKKVRSGTPALLNVHVQGRR
ncbi:thiamine pyrophosphate-requiring protein [Bradyrhizobium sp. LHD-71]|uniref:thiamine pyrophosphate-requiring protein n=1 Tax=Bradyrhizobium sp. LHD-71 TaxID=3072141 RepID=UPI00280FE3B6|nr:thiamine pyrophosphate-requiring protein [Bradyrhizobium sp. LHD-71]MDQ8731979.1 thiamine pyrophosphate-requiring protein [Bradyrhizobium sp. LHD-71]